jgi:hypothetical protein
MKLFIQIREKNGTVENTETSDFHETETEFILGKRKIKKSEVRSVIVTGFEPFWAD